MESIASRSFVICKTLNEYAAAVLDLNDIEAYIGASCFPVFDNVPERIDIQKSRLGVSSFLYVESASCRILLSMSSRELCAYIGILCNTRCEVKGPCCIVNGEDSSAVLGACYALATGKRLIVLSSSDGVRNLSKAVESSSSAVVVMTSAAFGARGIDFFREAMSANRNNLSLDLRARLPWGILTSQTTEDLSYVLARIILRVARRSIGRVYDIETRESARNSNYGPPLKSLEIRPADDIHELTGTPILFAAFVGHGRQYCALAGNLCSRSTAAERGDTACINGYDCVFSKLARVPVANLLVDLVLMDSCSTASFQLAGPERDTGMNIASNMLNGNSIGVISPYRTNIPCPLSAYFLWSLLLGGTRLGTACSTLNEFIRPWCKGHDPYILLGEPEMVPFDGPFLAPRRATATNPEAGIWSLDIERNGSCLDIYMCDTAGFVEMAHKALLHVLPDPKTMPSPLIHVFVDETKPSEATVVCFWSDEPNQCRTTILLTTRCPFRTETASMALQCLENLACHIRTAPTTCLSVSVQDCYKTLELVLCSVEASAVDSQARSVLSASQFVALYTSEQRVIAICEQVNGEVMKSLVTHSYGHDIWIYDFYSSRRGLCNGVETVLDEPCWYCKRKLQARTYQIGLWPPHFRALLECEACMFVSDTQVGYPRLSIKASGRVMRPEQATVTLQLTNTLDTTAIVHLAVLVDRMGYPADDFDVAPSGHLQHLAPGESFEGNFSIRFSSVLPNHLFHIKAIAVVNGAVSWSLHKLEVLSR